MGDRRDLVWAALTFGGVCAVNAVTGASGLASWERRFFAAPALSALIAFFLVGLCVMAAARLTPTQAGLNASQPARWLEIGCMALGVLGPIGGMAFAVAGDPRHAPGAWIILIAQLLCLPLLGFFLRRTRRVEQASGAHVVAGLLAGVAVTLVAMAALAPVLPAAARALHLLVLVGIGEELVFRGVIQGLLDRAWGTPWRVMSADVGWGWFVQALLFGLVHPLVAGDPGLWPWGLWTAASGLCFGWLRARSGTILAPAMVHGVTDAIGLVLVPLLVMG